MTKRKLTHVRRSTRIQLARDLAEGAWHRKIRDGDGIRSGMEFQNSYPTAAGYAREWAEERYLHLIKESFYGGQ